MRLVLIKVHIYKRILHISVKEESAEIDEINKTMFSILRKLLYLWFQFQRTYSARDNKQLLLRLVSIQHHNFQQMCNLLRAHTHGWVVTLLS